MILSETRLAIRDAVRVFARERIRPRSSPYRAVLENGAG